MSDSKAPRKDAATTSEDANEDKVGTLNKKNLKNQAKLAASKAKKYGQKYRNPIGTILLISVLLLSYLLVRNNAQKVVKVGKQVIVIGSDVQYSICTAKDVFVNSAKGLAEKVVQKFHRAVSYICDGNKDSCDALIGRDFASDPKDTNLCKDDAIDRTDTADYSKITKDTVEELTENVVERARHAEDKIRDKLKYATNMAKQVQDSGFNKAVPENLKQSAEDAKNGESTSGDVLNKAKESKSGIVNDVKNLKDSLGDKIMDETESVKETVAGVLKKIGDLKDAVEQRMEFGDEQGKKKGKKKVSDSDGDVLIEVEFMVSDEGNTEL